MKVSEIQVAYLRDEATGLVRVNNSRDAFDIVIEHYDKDTIDLQESVKILLLNPLNFVLGVYDMSKGAMTQCVLDFRLILGVALKCAATSIIVVHNHPSGLTKPSKDDLAITRKLGKACKIMGINLCDHLIISRKSYYSLRDGGDMN